MERYRSLGPADDVSITEGDRGFTGINQYDAPENLKPGEVQAATNMDFSGLRAETRGGFVCLPALALKPLTLNWTSRTSAADNQWRGIAYGNNQFVAVAQSGSGNRVMTSIDGVEWTARTSAADKSWRGVAYGNGIFVVTDASGSGTQSVQTSLDGINWTLRTLPVADGFWNSVAFGNGTFVIVGYTGLDTTRVLTSDDGINWTARTPSQSGAAFESVTYGGDRFVAVASSGGVGGSIMYSLDGITWVNGFGQQNNYWTSVAYGAGVFVAVALNGTNRVMTSTDGSAWTLRTAAEANQWQSVTYGAGLFVAVSSDGTNRVMVSRDGSTWVTSAAGAANQWIAIAFGAGVYAAVSFDGSSDRAMTSGQSTLVYASGEYSDPNDVGSRWVVLVGPRSVGFYAFGRSARIVNIASGYTVTEPSTVVQCNNRVFIFRGSDQIPLYWDGNWGSEFTAAPTTPAPGAGFTTIPYSNQATYYQNRLWVKDGKDSVAASGVLDFVVWDEIAEEFNLNTGDSDYVVTTYPFGDTTLVVFKNKSILALQNVAGSLSDVVATEVTRQVGAIGINAVVSVGSDLVYVSDRNINLLSLTSTNNALQHKTLPLSSKIQPILKRVNWNYASKVSLAYWDNKLYVSLPLDNSTFCNAVVVYNFVNDSWFGEWSFDSTIDMRIQGWVIGNYLGLQRLHCVTEDGRIFVVGEGHQDVSGATVAEVESSVTTRAYRMNDDNRVSRRMYADLETNRPCFSIAAFSEGANESSTILTDRTYSRSQSWLFNDGSYSLNNSGDNYNRAYRKDYAGYCGDNIQARSGFVPGMLQSSRIILPVRRKGRLAWFQITNTTGRIVVNGVGSEARPGDRGSFVQVG